MVKIKAIIMALAVISDLAVAENPYAGEGKHDLHDLAASDVC